MASVVVNLLLVDDRPENLVVLEELLDQPDRKLIKATSGNEALRLLLKHDVALVLLDLQMPGMDGYEVVSSEINAVTVLDEVVAGLSSDLASAGATVTHDALPTVRGNRILLAQTFQNLIANSIKFHGAESPRIHVAAQRVATDWQFSVRDNGIGIPANEREQVFRLFHRLASDGGGTGIGLTLCKRAVEKLDGKIWVGPGDGTGATFYFTIPDRRP